MAFVYGFICGSLLFLFLATVYHYKRRVGEDKRGQSEASRVCAEIERNRAEGCRIAEEAGACGATVEGILTLVEHRPLDNTGDFRDEE